MTVYLNGVAQAGSAWSLLSTGEVRFTTPPGVGVVVTATGEFNIACRFTQDNIELAMETFEAGAIPSFGVMEVRE